MKRERFFAQVYFSNETVSQTTVSTGPMKMFRLEHETMNVCQRNVACFGHSELNANGSKVHTCKPLTRQYSHIPCYMAQLLHSVF